MGGRALARKLLKDLHALVEITLVGPTEIGRALDSEFADFEDGVQWFSSGNLPFISRNTVDFPPGDSRVHDSNGVPCRLW